MLSRVCCITVTMLVSVVTSPMANITGLSYLHAGLLKWPLLNTTPLKGAENWRLTIMPVFSHVTSSPVMVGMLAGPPWAPVTPPSMRRLWRRDWIWPRENWNTWRSWVMMDDGLVVDDNFQFSKRVISLTLWTSELTWTACRSRRNVGSVHLFLFPLQPENR